MTLESDRGILHKFQDKYGEAKKNDAARKRSERESFKEDVDIHPRKYRSIVEKRKEQNLTRVRRFRAKAKLNKDTESPKAVNSQTLRRNKESKRTESAQKRQKESEHRDSTRKRVQSFRLRVKLGKISSNMQFSPPVQIKESPDSYRHRSSLSRAYKRVCETLPETPAKNVRIIEKIVKNTTPRSRSALTQSPSIQAVFTNTSRRNLDDDYSLLESVKLSISEAKEKKKEKSCNTSDFHQAA